MTVRRDPAPLPISEAERLAALCEPELECAPIWSVACERWWTHPEDFRLRGRASDALFLTPEELASWATLALDVRALRRAHAHVVTMRISGESGGAKRAVASNALRTVSVVTHGRDGSIAYFPDAKELPARVARVCQELETLPDHPFLRAAWISQALGATHAFVDGNGGTARFLSSIQLTRSHFPPLILSTAQRNGAYIEAIVDADRVGLQPLVQVVYDVVQRELAIALISGAPSATSWTDTSRQRASTWVRCVDQAWNAVVGSAAVDTREDEIGPLFARRGLRIAANAGLTRWSSSLEVPVQFVLAISPAKGGDETWTVASIAAFVGVREPIAALTPPDVITAFFVAPDVEPERLALARLSRWLEFRVGEFVKGLAAWM